MAMSGTSSTLGVTGLIPVLYNSTKVKDSYYFESDQDLIDKEFGINSATQCTRGGLERRQIEDRRNSRRGLDKDQRCARDRRLYTAR